MFDPLKYPNIMKFITGNNIVNEKGEPITFDKRFFLYDILTDWSQYQVIKKCAQVGMSVTEIVKTLYAVRTYKWNIIYTLPSDDDAAEFVNTKTNKLIQANPQAFYGIQSDNVERKEIEDRFLYYKGTISKTAAIATTADLLVHDEKDRSSQTVLETYKSRIKNSSFKGIWELSNPSVEKNGVDLTWQKSDQKEWEIQCAKCKTWQILTWPESIDLQTANYICKHCGRILSDSERAWGRWTAQMPGMAISGYHISLLMAPWTPAQEIIDDSEGDQEYFYNFVLGEPFSPGNMRVAKTTILDCWTPKSIETGQWYLGVDVGNIKHYVLGSEKGIIEIGTFTQWHNLDELLTRYKPICVIDANPENDMARYYVNTYDNVFMSYYNADKQKKELVKWGEGDDYGVVHSDRNRLMDTVINEFLRGKILVGLATNKLLRTYLAHWETLRRIKEMDKNGVERYVWESTTGQDHFAHATAYYYLATLAKGYGVVMSTALPKEPELIIQTAEGPVMGDIKEILRRQQLEERYD